MTFKHVKFEDSPTMRALEKVAREKGLVKPELLYKEASTPKLDTSPGENLMDNILKLCAGLRSEGLAKYADELEVNFLNYKRAQTLYETSKETGDDLLQSAHPKGSHKLENVDSSEAVVEDILEKHLKILEVVNKRPHGNLSKQAQSNNSDSYNEYLVLLVKTVKEARELAEQMPDESFKQKARSELMNPTIEDLQDLISDLGDSGPEYALKSVLAYALQLKKQIDAWDKSANRRNQVGKLSVTSAIKSAKVVLAETNDEAKQRMTQAMKYNINSAVSILGKIADKADQDLTFSVLRAEGTDRILAALDNPTIDTLEDAKKGVGQLKQRVSPGTFYGVTKDTWSMIESLFSQMYSLLDRALSFRKALNDLEVNPLPLEEPKSENKEVTLPTVEVDVGSPEHSFALIDELLGKLNAWKTIPDLQKYPQAMTWINKEMATLSGLKKNYSTVPPEQQYNIRVPLANSVDKENRDIISFKSQWVDAVSKAK